ncbi:MAG: transcriptional repressor LexA [Gemmataceae bacterium]
MPNFDQLTKRQREIYDFIKEKIEERGYGPTVREIGEFFDIKSPNGVMCHLKALVKKGLINREEKSARAIQLVDYERPTASNGLPLIGTVAAGSPLLAVENAERLEFNELFNESDCVVLKVRGQSMIEEHIDDGDFVVIKKRNTAMNGECVVAQIEDEVTLKRFYEEDDHICLKPANKELEDIRVPKSAVSIVGVLVGVVRRC